MRAELEALAASPRAQADPKVRAALRRLLSPEADDTSEEFYRDLRTVTMFRLRLQFEERRGG